MPENNENLNKTEEQEKTPKKRKKRSFASKLLRVSAFIVTLIILLLIGIFIFIQTPAFNKLALDFTLDKLNDSWKEKESTITAESITGNILTGIQLNNGAIIVKGDTMTNFSYILVQYDLWGLLKKNINIEKLVVSEPQFNLVEVKGKNDSLIWNVAYLFSSDEVDEDTTSSPFEWDVNLENMELHNGSAKIYNRKDPNVRLSEINFGRQEKFALSDLAVTNINMALNAKYYPNLKEIHVTEFNFKTNSDVDMKKLTMDATIDENTNETTLKNLVMQTTRSNVYFNTIYMSNLNPFDSVNVDAWKDNNVDIDIVTDNFDFKDLKFFFPNIDFLDSTVYLNLKANGKYGDLNIEKLELKTPVSYYNFSGKLQRLDDPSKMYFDITGTNMEIDPADTKIVLPGLNITDYSYLGKVSIPHITYVGEATRFNSEFDIRSTAGNASGKIFLDLNQPYLIYNGDISARNVNIGRIIKDKSLESDINADIIADGRGTDYKTMDLKLNFDINSSRLMGQSVTKSSGQILLNKGNADLNISYLSSGGSAKIDGKVGNIGNIDNLSYNLKGFAKNLDISGFTKDASQKSNLNFTFNINGKGISPDNIAGKFSFDINRSSYGNLIFPETPLIAELGSSAGERTVSIKSDILDFDAHGRFTFSSIGNVINSNIEDITTGLTAMMNRQDTLRDSTLSEYKPVIPLITPIRKTVVSNVNSGSDVYLAYNLDIKNLTPVSSYTDTALVLKTRIKGTLRNENNIFTMSLDIDTLNMKYADSLLIVNNGRLNLDVTNNPSSSGLEGFGADFRFYSDSLIASGNKLDTVSVDFNFRDYTNQYSIFATNKREDTTVVFNSRGMVDLYKDKIRLVMDTLLLNYKNYNLHNHRPLLISYNSAPGEEGIDFERFRISSGNQRIQVSGKYSFDSVSDVKVSGDNISLAEFQKFSQPGIKDKDLIIGNLRRLEATFKGSTANPDFYAEINTDPFIVEGNAVGRLDAIVEYKDNVLKPDISFFNANNEGNLKVYGDVPYKNPLSGDTAASSVKLTDQNVDLQLESNNFQFAFVSQFLKGISNLRGNLDGKLKITGTAGRPLLNGGLTIKNANLTLDATNMYYGFNANISTENQKLVINNSKLFDPNEESRFLSTTGYIDFTDLKLNDMQLEMTGDVKVFDKSNDPTSFGISGDLIAGSGSPHLKLTGNSEAIEVTGNLLLKSGNITLNPTGAQAYNIYDDDFTYTLQVDSSQMSDSMKAYLKEEILKLRNREYAELNPFEQKLVPENAIVDSNAAPPSIFIFDVHVTSEKQIYLRFIVNERTKQEFFGNVNTDLYVDNRKENNMSAYGTVELGDDSYYRFYKRFEASGNLDFTGEISNPKLNVNAEYNSRNAVNNDPANGTDEYKVILKVTGRAQKPDLAFSVEKNGVPIGGSDPTSEAMALILFGRPTGGTQSSIVTSVGANVGSIFVSDYLAGLVQDALPFIVNTDINYVDTRDGSVAQNTNLTLTAEFGDAIVKVGGQVFDDVNNANIVIQYPLNKLLKFDNVGNNLILQLERVVDPFSSSSLERVTRDTRIGALVYYRIKF